MKRLTDRHHGERLTPGRAMPKLGAYQRRLTEMELWLGENRSALAAFARGAGCRLPDCAAVLRIMVSNSRNAECDLTQGQLASKTLLSEAQVKRCLKALSEAGCWVQVIPGCSAGRLGGAGRGAVRLLTMIGTELQAPTEQGEAPQPTPTPAPPAAEMTVQYSGNDGAVECTPLRNLPSETHPAQSVQELEPVPTQQGGGEQEQEPTQGRCVARFASARARVTTTVPTPDRRAFPNAAAWCEAMAQHARKTGRNDDTDQAGATDDQPSSDNYPMPSATLLQQVADAAGRRYADSEALKGGVRSVQGLARHAASQHLESLRALCASHGHWRRWVQECDFATVVLAVYYWHADRMLSQVMVQQLNAEAERSQRTLVAGPLAL